MRPFQKGRRRIVTGFLKVCRMPTCPRLQTALIRFGVTEVDAAVGHPEAAREHLAVCIPELEAAKMRPGVEQALALKERLAIGQQS